jgi:DNA primase
MPDRLGSRLRQPPGPAQDAFRARVLFPICDPSGHPVALGGRILPPGPGPSRSRAKYKNSQESPIYSKRRTLYALNWAKQDVIAQGRGGGVRGLHRRHRFFQAGVERAVATCGTALAEEHFTLLRNFASRRIVLAYDADGAGQRPPRASTSGSAGTRSTWWWRPAQRAPTPATLARTDPEALRPAVEEARRSCSSGWTGSWTPSST